MQAPTPTRIRRSQRGAVSVELVGTLPFLGLALLAAAQIAISGAALWSAAISARAGARAAEVGNRPEAAARRALPPSLRDRASVSRRGGVRVRVPVPRLLPGMPQLGVAATSSLEADSGPG